jgi:FtsP/CotA-like multicopper oxidase with cupredoxin domain
MLAVAAVAAAISAGLGGPGVMQGAPGPATAAAERLVPADTDNMVPPAAGDTLLWQDSLIDPPVVRSVGGVLTATLVVDTATLRVDTTVVGGPADTASVLMNLRSYQLTSTTDPTHTSLPLAPAFPGPTFRVKHGDVVKIQLINSLPQGGPQDADDVCIQPLPDSVTHATITIPDVYQACFHGPNYTNIHYHGMHVTPDSTSDFIGDNVLLAIPPGDTLQYSFRIPQNQSPGTHWYHPHKHGSVAIQVANGMAGAFIVEDTTGLDSIVTATGMREHLIAIQQVAERVGLLGHQGELDRSPVLANGQYQPTIYMAPGEVQRWRIVNENTTHTTKTFTIGFADGAGQEPLLFDVARDGVQFAPDNYNTAVADTNLFMAPGQRLDVFVKAPQAAGAYTFQAVHNGGASRRTRNSDLVPGQNIVPDVNPLDTISPPGAVLFKVVVDPSRTAPTTTLPPSLPPLLDFLAVDLPAQSDTALIVFTDSLNQQPSQFYLGSRLNPFQRYDDDRVFVPSDTSGTAMPMALRQTQTWKIVNNSQQGINHPFHIHINPFQVDTVVYPMGVSDPFAELYEQLNAAAASGNPIWLDVLPLPQALPDTTIVQGTTRIALRTVYEFGVPKVDSAFKLDTIVSGTPNTAYVVITQKYDDFKGCPDGNCGPPTGSFVMHCHILGHEERGMMQVLQVVEPWNQVSPPAASAGSPGGAHHPAPATGGNGGHGSGGQPPHRH